MLAPGLAQLSKAERKGPVRLLLRFIYSTPLKLTWRVFKEMGADQATHAAAGVAYYAVFSIFPLILALLAISGIFLSSPDIEGKLLTFLTDNLPGSEQFVVGNVESLIRFRGPAGLVGVAGLFWAASAVFGGITLAVNRAWDVEETRPFYIAKPRQLLMALGVGVLFLVSMSASSAVQILGPTFGAAGLQLVGYLTTFLMFILMYRYIPNTQTYWRYIWLGALVAAILFELAKNAFVWYVANFANFQAYGSLASVLIFLAWAYFSALILILGAEVSTEYERMEDSPCTNVASKSA